MMREVAIAAAGGLTGFVAGWFIRSWSLQTKLERLTTKVAALEDTIAIQAEQNLALQDKIRVMGSHILDLPQGEETAEEASEETEGSVAITEPPIQ